MAPKKGKRRPKVAIVYPPLTMKKWIPPDLRTRRPKPKPVPYPHQLTQKLTISSLLKVWHDYKIVNDCAVLLGDISIYHPRFTYVTNGLQGHAFCIVCALYSKLAPCYHWCSKTIDEICILGDKYFQRSIRFRRTTKPIMIEDLCKDLFIHSHKITICFKGERYKGLVAKNPEINGKDCLTTILKAFFEAYSCGVLYTETPTTRYFTLWKFRNGYFLFDPTDHDEMCWPLKKPLLGKGHTFVVRFPTTDRLVQVLQRQLLCVNSEFVLLPVNIARIAYVNTRYPDCLKANYEEMDPHMKAMLQKEAEEKKCMTQVAKVGTTAEKETEKKQPSRTIPDNPDGDDSESRKDDDPSDSEDEFVYEDGKLVCRGHGKKQIVERPRVESVTYFKYTVANRIGIILAETHQDDPEFDRCFSLKDFCMALGAIVHLRETKAKYWTSRLATNALRLGFRICIESLMRQSPDRMLKVANITKKIDLNDRAYTATIDEYGAVGRYNSEDPNILDLLPALKELLSEYDTVIINGPLVTSVWKEEGLYYMFDPHERDPNGFVIVKAVQSASTTEAVNASSGVACLTWFKDLQDLVNVYMANLDRCKRHEQFLIASVVVNDYLLLPENWFNFKAVCPNMWILQGTSAQSDLKYPRDSRNTQCTANCLLALVYYQRKCLKEWTVETIDAILDQGDEYYHNCVQNLIKRDKFINNMLLLSEVLTDFVLDNNLVSLDIKECIVNGVITVGDTYRTTLNLVNGLAAFFKDNDLGILTCRGASVALMKDDNGYFYFDPHDRDDHGFALHRGKACIIRALEIKLIAQILMANLAADPKTALFNISQVAITICPRIPPGAQPDEDDSDSEAQSTGENPIDHIVVERPLFNYIKLTKKRAILRGTLHQQNKMVFDNAAGKQTIPNLVVAPGMARIFSPDKWTSDVVDNALKTGQRLYDHSIQRLYKLFNKETPHSAMDDEFVGEEEVPTESDDITMDNVSRMYKIGVNAFSVEFEPISEGFIGRDGTDLWYYLSDEFAKDPRDADDFHEMILHTDVLDVVLWKTNTLFYLFDPNPRDTRGNVYGHEDWSEVSTSEAPPEFLDEDEEENQSMYYAAEPVVDATVVPSTPDEMRDMLEKEYEHLGIGGEEGEVSAPLEREASYWDKLAQAEGRACILWFTKVTCLVKHLLENSPPKYRNEMVFRLSKLILRNSADVKDVYDPSMGPKPDRVAGDWHNWAEITRGEWILRASMAETNPIFPVCNRGIQSPANCLIALSYAFIYRLCEFSKATVDQILKYGDRLYTSTRKVRRKELEDLDDPALTAEEIEVILENETYTVDTMIKTFCVGDESVAVKLEDKVISGEVNAQDVEEELDIYRALVGFFSGGDKFGAIVCKNRVTGVFSVNNVFYMFDSGERGPHGVVCRNGVACFTRFTEIASLVNLYLQNIPQCGKNYFALYEVKIGFAECKKPEKDELRSPVDPLHLIGFENVAPCKMIIQGTISQEDPQFGRGPNAQSSTIAGVALVMTLLHETEYWTKLIIDEIVRIGDEVYAKYIDRCDIMFNPWEEKLTVALSPKDFLVGRNRVNIQLRSTDQKGIIGTNLRIRIEAFFEENCYGILESDSLTVAIWKEDTCSDVEHLYMFDANPRSDTGMPQEDGGAACVLRFTSAKCMSDHILTLVPHNLEGTFLIIPIEIVIQRDGKKVKKTKNYDVARPDQPETSKSKRLGRIGFYMIPGTSMSILRGTKSQSHKSYSRNSQGKQDVPNCLVAYVMDKLIPIPKWTYKNIDMILDQGDLLYKDSYIIFNPNYCDKIGLETIIRDVVIRDIRVKISIGAPVLTSQFSRGLFTEALVACFNLKNFCIVLLDQWAVAIFKKCDTFYLFDPTDLSLDGNRVQRGGWAAVIQFKNIEGLIGTFMKNMAAKPMKNDVFRIIIAAVKKIERIPVGVTFTGQENPQDDEKSNPSRTDEESEYDRVLYMNVNNKKRK